MGAYLFRDIPPEIWRELKELAKKRHLSLRVMLILILEEFISKKEN